MEGNSVRVNGRARPARNKRKNPGVGAGKAGREKTIPSFILLTPVV